MNISQSITRAFEDPRFALAFRVCIIVLLACMLTLISSPTFAFAQQGGGDGGGNPFADAGARSTAVDFLRSLRFWVWIAGGFGFCLFAIAYFIQGIFPSFYQQFRDFLRYGAMLLVVFGFVLTFIISQASGS